MNARSSVSSDSHGRHLLLFVADDSPRSHRARTNLKEALEGAGLGATRPREIDLLNVPEEAIAHGVFATPALLYAEGDDVRTVLYGDLSDRERLLRFLAECGATGPAP